MKNISLATCLLLMVSCAQPDLPYRITGNVANEDPEFTQVILSRFDPITQKRTPVDTSELDADGNYELAFQLEEPDLFQLRFPGKQTTTILCDPIDKNVTIDAEGRRSGRVKVTGSEATALLQGYDSFRAESNQRLIRPAYADMTKASEANDEAGEITAVEAYVNASKIHRQELLEYTKEHIGTSPALFGTVLRWTGDEEIGLLDELVSNFKSAHPDWAMTQVMEDKVNRYRKVAIGAVIPELIQNDPDGNAIDIRDHLGSYTLIDFWASWCGPCILQIPDIKAAQAQFGDQGFKVFGVSFDSNAEKWKGAIDKYGLDWPHVSDVIGWQSQQATDFNVTFIPFNLLVDAEGRIVAKNLHSKALATQLEELLSTDS